MELKSKAVSTGGQAAVTQSSVLNHCMIDPLLCGCPEHGGVFSGLPVVYH